MPEPTQGSLGSDSATERRVTSGFVAEGWWHPNVKAGQVHDHPTKPGRSWSVASHRQCEQVYTDRGREVAEDRIALLEELLADARGDDVEKRVRATIMQMHAALKERNADEGMLNLISGFAHVAALAIAKGRWAVLENRDNERLREAIRNHLDDCLGGAGFTALAEAVALSNPASADDPQTPENPRT